MFRDAMVQNLVTFTTLDTQAYRPVNVFLNGNYWGFLNIRERMDEYYIESHYGIDPKEVLIYEVSKYEDFYSQDPDENEFLSLLRFIKDQENYDDVFYKTLEGQIDIQNFIDNQIVYLYAANDDWLENNVKFWKMTTGSPDPDVPYGQDGRWRWMVIDFDSAFVKYEKNMITFTTMERDYTRIMSTLMKNPDYMIEFINRFADLLNTAFLPSRVAAEIDRMESALEGDIEKQINRWGNLGNSIDQWHANVDEMREFALKRPGVVREHIIEEFGLDGTYNLQVITDPKQGYVRVNSMEIFGTTPGINDPSHWSGIYFKELPITLTAIPQKGYQFSHWEGIDPNISENESITLTPADNLQITPIFEKID
jgi:hypothetical protein